MEARRSKRFAIALCFSIALRLSISFPIGKRKLEVELRAPWIRVDDKFEALWSETRAGWSGSDPYDALFERWKDKPFEGIEKMVSSMRLSSPEAEARRKDALEDRSMAGLDAQGSCCWLHWCGSVHTDVGSLDKLLSISSECLHRNETRSILDTTWDLNPEDAMLATKEDVPRALLYASVDSDCFREFHDRLIKAHRERKIRYVLRPHTGLKNWKGQYCDGSTIKGSREKTSLYGFGVELALKNTEYQARNDEKHGTTLQDDLDLEETISMASEKETIGISTADVDVLEDAVQYGAMQMDKELPSEEAMELVGLKIAASITNSTHPFEALELATQNLPFLVRGLGRIRAKRSVQRQVKALRSTFGDGGQFLVINGQSYPLENLDAYSLIDHIVQEMKFATAIKKYGVPSGILHELMSLGKATEGEILVDPRSEHCFLVNDLEKDHRYRGWSRSLSSMLSFSMPGQFQPVRKNTCLLVISLDPGSPSGAETMISMVAYLRRLIPVQFGLYLIVPDHIEVLSGSIGKDAHFAKVWAHLSISEQISRAFHFLQQSRGRSQAFEFLVSVSQVFADSSHGKEVRWPSLQMLFLKHWPETVSEADKENGIASAKVALQSLEQGSGSMEAFAMSREAFNRGFSEDLPFAIVNGRVVPQLGPVQYALSLCLQMQQLLVEAIYTSELTDSDNVLEWVFDGSVPKYNKEIFESSGVPDTDIVKWDLDFCLAALLPQSEYLHQPGTEDNLKTISQIVVADFSSAQGQQLLMPALEWILLKKSGDVQLAFFSNPRDSSTFSFLDRALMALQAAPSRRAKVVTFLHSLFQKNELLNGLAQPVVADEVLDHFYGAASDAGLHVEQLKVALSEEGNFSVKNSIEKQQDIWRCLEGKLHISKGESVVINNARRFSIGAQKVPFTAYDFWLMSASETQRLAGLDTLLMKMLEKSGSEIMPSSLHTYEHLSELAARISSLLWTRPQVRQSIDVGRVLEAMDAIEAELELNNVTIWHRTVSSDLKILALVDPFSPKARKLSSLFVFLQKYLEPSMKVVLNPSSNPSPERLGSFYRFALPNEFSESKNGPFIEFQGLPEDKILTMNIDVPETWLVAPIEADRDLDNILLQDLPPDENLLAIFQLESLLVTGSCIDQSARTQKDLTPRGLQLHLGNSSVDHVTDTLVMSNLGYFQLKASPGKWVLNLAPGRSQELFTVPEHSQRGRENSEASEEFGTSIVIRDFVWKHMQFFVNKRPGKEKEDVLDDQTTKHSSYLSKLSSVFAPSKTSDKRIHVFSIASGHLYERLLKIMILSILRNTKSPVKFWFIRNYFSPGFAAYMPYMAADYKFEYEFITYKWPSWLHKQTEKQRIIWAYKILFLDVIFPLNLQRVIFVDADQVVRADLKELMEMDLHGAPYAYTPFCDNNKEMDGYRFWKQGFWKEHLRGKPYHISALYVVDLKRFRETAAGDQLRVVYDQLSKDPNSLSNLDQDLPNYVQHQVPIFSLPQEWLWCESWCGDKTKAAAKTIDLCNNPMTKEPKQAAARRIVAEWPDLDREVRQHTEFVRQQMQEGNKAGLGSKPWKYVKESSVEDPSMKHGEL